MSRIFVNIILTWTNKIITKVNLMQVFWISNVQWLLFKIFKQEKKIKPRLIWFSLCLQVVDYHGPPQFPAFCCLFANPLAFCGTCSFIWFCSTFSSALLTIFLVFSGLNSQNFLSLFGLLKIPTLFYCYKWAPSPPL